MALLLGIGALGALACSSAIAQSQSCATVASGGEQNSPIAAPACVVGELAPSKVLLLPITLPTDGSHASIGAFLEAEGELELCLLGADGARLQCRRGTGEVMLVDLVGTGTGGHSVHLRQDGSEATRFRLELGLAAPEADEAEPNDTLAQASPMRDGEASGRWLGDEYDYYSFQVTGAPRLWRFEAAGSGLSMLDYLDGSGRSVLQRSATNGEVSMTNLFLLPGRHYLAVRGADSDYSLRAIPLAEPGEDAEREFNDDTTRALALPRGAVRSGTLDAGDSDYYRFTLYAREYVRIEVEPNEGTGLNIYLDDLYSTRQDLPPGEPTVYQALLLPGDHYLRVQPSYDQTGDYRIGYVTLDPLALPADVEPNDEEYQAGPMPATGSIEGELSRNDNEDWYRLPPLKEPSTVTMETEGSPQLTFYRVEGERYEQVARVNGESDPTVELPAASDLRLQVYGEQPYRLAFDPVAFGLSAPAPVQLGVTVEADDVPLSAYWHEGQIIEGVVTVENDGPTPRQVELRTASSHYEWRPRLAQTRLLLEPGETRRVPLTVEVLPDARADISTRITVQARPSGANGTEDEGADLYFRADGPTGTLEFTAVCGAPPLRPTAVWPVPAELLGGLDLAAAGLGGTIADPAGSGAALALIDGMVAPSTGWQGVVGNSVTFRLAQPALPIAGLLLNPYSHGRPQEWLDEFEVQASDDGERFDTILEGRLRPEPVEQALLFDSPVTTSYLRLVALSNQSGYRGRITLGEFKAVAAEAEGFFGGLGADLAAPANGGYLVWTKPDRHPGPDVFSETSGGWGAYLDEGETAIEWAIGFHNDRAARVAALEWVPPKTVGGPPLESVEVAISLDSPVGPWTVLGTWDVARQSRFELEGAPWVRFVRISARGLPEKTGYSLPAAVKVFEAPTSGDYRTILGEWGQSQKTAVFEAQQGQSAQVALSENDDNDTVETAQLLVDGESVEGQVVIGEDVDWYRISVPEGENSFELTLSGEPVLGVEYDLLDDGGKPVLFDESGSSAQKTLTAFVQPGDYYLRLEEPPRSVVFAWDNSGSMGPYLDIIYQTVAGFVQDVQPGREVAQLLAFEEDPRGVFLLPDWSGDPLELMSALNDYDRSAGSSNAEASLLASTLALGEREGTRAIMFMTDAESPGLDLNARLWTELERVRPRIFTFETSSAGSTYTQDLMQSWADVAGGYYDYARGVGDFEAGFDRATCHLRRPARYSLLTDTEYREPPGPGLLSVVRAEGTAGNPPVEIILDLSGSMSRPLPSGPSRVAVAKKVLDDLVAHTLPAGTPFALRMFGHIRPNSCDTRLDLPLGPLDSAQVQRVVAAAQPQLLSGTPLADSLLEVPHDLGDRGDGATVILLTDGEESCGGDVEAAVTALRDSGFSVQLHIISFDVASDEAKAAFAQWARLGGGRFFDTSDEAALASALRDALQPAFEVLAPDGTVVAVGTVGGAGVSVPPGLYSISIAGETVIEDVRVRGDDERVLTLGGDGS